MGTDPSPMEYTFEDETGPVDPNSPFIVARRKVSQQDGKRAFNAAPSLQPPASSPVYFSQNSGGRPADTSRAGPTEPQSCPVRNPPWKHPVSTPPRNLFANTNNSVETPETPGDPDKENANDDPTPDTSAMNLNFRGPDFLTSGRKKNNPHSRPANSTGGQSKEGKRNSWLNDFTKRFESPGQRFSFRVGKVGKMKKGRGKPGQKRARARRGADVDSDDEGKGKRSSGNQRLSGGIAAILSYIDLHPNLPHTLSYYAQLVLNFFFVGCIIWIVYSFWSAIQSDVNIEADRAIAEALAEMAICARDYNENRCEPATRVPAMSQLCDNWQACMERDPKKVGRARVSAHTFATIFNSFIEPISWKAMFFCLIIVTTCLFANNIAFTKFRNTHPVHQQQGHHESSQHYGQWQPQPPCEEETAAEDAPSHPGWATPKLLMDPNYYGNNTPYYMQSGSRTARQGPAGLSLTPSLPGLQMTPNQFRGVQGASKFSVASPSPRKRR